ncbi:MAG TPA: M48 family metallopeptidase [Thiobacillaceae bacterium]|nr:M48 family metallopeptidase [Thiobacillaceae bacterium]
MWEFKVLVFAPGHSPAGVRARVSFHGDAMSVKGHQLFMTIEGRRVRLKTGGYDGRQWLLSWPGDGGEVTAALQGEAEIRLMQEYAPPSLAAQLQRAVRSSGRRQGRFRLLIITLILLLLLPLLLLWMFWLNSERIAGWVAGHVGMQTEKQLGELAFGQMKPGLKLIQSGGAQQVVREIGERLTAGSAYDYLWFVADDPQVNAFAMPGGYVVVNSGLLKAAGSAEELAGVLAHEVQHVEQRHALKNLIHALGWRAVLSMAMGDLSGGIWLDAADQLGRLHYSRDLEREADMKALHALHRAGISAHGLPDFFARLATRDSGQFTLLSSHPTSGERLQAIRQAISAAGGNASPSLPLAYDWQLIRNSLP